MNSEKESKAIFELTHENQIVWGQAVLITHLVGSAVVVTAAIASGLGPWGLLGGAVWAVVNMFVLVRHTATPIYKYLCRRKGLTP